MTCTFCDKQSETVLTDTEVDLAIAGHARVWASVGAFVPGWLLAVTTTHALSTATLSREGRKLFWSEVDLQTARLESAYGPTTVFEHGPKLAGSPVGCSIDHAHAHIVPLSFDLFDASLAHAPLEGWRDVTGTPWAEPAEASKDGYLYLRLSSGTEKLLVDGPIPSQYFRRVIAAELGLEKFDWRDDLRRAVQKSTIESLVAA